MYSEVGGRPQTWDQSQKGTVTFNEDYRYDFYGGYMDDYGTAMLFMNLPLSAHAAVNLCLAEYVFVSLSLALIIAKFSQQFTTRLSPKQQPACNTRACTGELP